MNPSNQQKSALLFLRLIGQQSEKVVKALALHPTREPYAHEFCLQTKLPAGSVRRALEYLLKKDIIYINENGVYQILDPAIKYYFLF